MTCDTNVKTQMSILYFTVNVKLTFTESLPDFNKIIYNFICNKKAISHRSYYNVIKIDLSDSSNMQTSQLDFRVGIVWKWIYDFSP